MSAFMEQDLPYCKSLISRARRVFRVRDLESGKYYYLKDGWREDMPGKASEQDIIMELSKEQVPHIPVIRAGGDIRESNHSTLTDKYVNSAWRIGPPVTLVPRVHYRFLEEEVERSLSKFKGARELCQVLADVIEGISLTT